MKAIVKERPGEDGTLFRTDVEEPTPGYGKVKIKVMAASICGSDVHALYNGYMADKYRYPVVLGHEGAGIVVEVGEGVHSIKVGDRVTSETTFETCMTCEYCRKSEFNLCPSRKGLGSAADGYFAQYCIAAENSCHKLADDISFEEGALAEPLACAVHATCILTNPQPGDVVLVSGPGPIGTMAAAIAKLAGCIVVLSGINSDAKRLNFAREHYNIQHVVDTTTTDLKEYVGNLTEGRGADFVYECSGARPGIISGLDICKKKGCYVGVGLNTSDIPLDYYHIIYTKEITILGDKSTNAMSWLRAMRLINNHLIDLKAMVTHELPLERWLEGYDLSRRGEAMKVVLKPQEN